MTTRNWNRMISVRCMNLPLLICLIVAPEVDDRHLQDWQHPIVAPRHSQHLFTLYVIGAPALPKRINWRIYSC